MLYIGVTRVELPGTPAYHFMTDMTNQAVAWMRFQQTMTPDRPFFMYFAPGATLAPHHVPKQWRATLRESESPRVGGDAVRYLPQLPLGRE